MIRKMVICTLLFGMFLLMSGCGLSAATTTEDRTGKRLRMKEAAERGYAIAPPI